MQYHFTYHLRWRLFIYEALACIVLRSFVGLLFVFGLDPCASSTYWSIGAVVAVRAVFGKICFGGAPSRCGDQEDPDEEEGTTFAAS